jgi:hypothetical protein
VGEPAAKLEGEPNLVFRRWWWIVPEGLKSVWGYIRAHPVRVLPYPQPEREQTRISFEQTRASLSLKYSWAGSVAEPFEDSVLRG